MQNVIKIGQLYTHWQGDGASHSFAHSSLESFKKEGNTSHTALTLKELKHIVM
jgi:hypothetical protein